MGYISSPDGSCLTRPTATLLTPATVTSDDPLLLLLQRLLIFHPDIQGRAEGKAKLLTTGGWQQKNTWINFTAFCEKNQLIRFHLVQNIQNFNSKGNCETFGRVYIQNL